jgi:murein DD-endopeptidase MepM/ murein hydrolase activator NlpD
MSYSKIPLAGEFRITCAFGEEGSTWIAGFHTGVDMVNDDQIIYSPTFGEVSKVGYDASYGNYVVIADDTPDDTHFHWLCHMQSYDVHIGDIVTPETIIGKMGSTGKSSGTHLHYEIRNYLNKYGVVDNPCDYMGIPNERGTYNEADYVIDDGKPEPPPVPVQPRNTVGEKRRFVEDTIIYSEPNLTGKEYEYLPNTSVKILENTSENVDKVYVIYTGRVGYVDINCYQ